MSTKAEVTHIVFDLDGLLLGKARAFFPTTIDPISPRYGVTLHRVHPANLGQIWADF